MLTDTDVYIHTRTLAKHCVCVYTRVLLWYDAGFTGACCIQVSET